MAKITDLPNADALLGDEFLPIVQKGSTKRVTMTLFRNLITPFLQNWYKGDKGDTGPSASTYTTRARLKAAPLSNRSYHFAPDETDTSGLPPATYYFRPGDFTGKVNDRDIIALDGVPVDFGALVRQRAAGVDYDGRDIADKLGEWASIRDTRFAGGAKGGGADDTAPIQAALDSGIRCIYVPPGDYRFTTLTIRWDYQRLFGPGARLIRTSATGTIRVISRGNHLTEILVGCSESGLAGDNITVNGPDFRASFCESRDCDGRAILALNCGGGFVIHGGTYQTTNKTDTGWDIEIRHDAPNSSTLYCWISKVLTNQHFAGFLINGGVGSSAIDKCEFGKLGMVNGGSAKVSNCRVGGKTVIRSGFASLSQTDFNDDVVIGEDGKANIGSVRLADTCTIKAGKTITICDNVVESTLHLGHLQSAGVTCVIRSFNNDLWHHEIDAPLQIGAQSGSPTFGDGTLISRMSSEGRRSFLHVTFQLGPRSSMGSGNFFYVIAPFKARSAATDIAQVTEAGVGHWTLALRMLEGSDQILFFPTSGGTAIATNANAATPFTWKSGDRMIFKIPFERIF